MSDKLRIFVSGNESELDDERATAFKVIKSLGFDPIGSENRTASSDSIESEYIGEVESSDFYIGIFGKEDSTATRKEFEKARSTGKCTLVFQKNVHSRERKLELEEFLNKIKDSQSGVVYLKYNSVVDLEIAIINSLSYYITKKFRECKKLQEKQKTKSNKEEIKSKKKLIEVSDVNETKLLQKMRDFPFRLQFADQFGKAEFIDFKIISELKKGEKHIVKAKIKGSTQNGFLDLAVKGPDGIWYWFPDPHSYDSPTDNGILHLNNQGYERDWEFTIPDKSGKYLAVIGLYENNFENRRVVNYEKWEFIVP